MGSFSVSSNGARVQTADGPQSLLAFDKPFTKLDTTNQVSFQTINILFNNEPPQPGVSTPADTLIYSFKHGYQYIPSVWMEWRNPAPIYPSSPGVGLQATTLLEFGDETAAENIIGVGSATQLSLLASTAYFDAVFGPAIYSTAFLYLKVDATNVNVWLRKFSLRPTSGTTAVPVFLVGVTVNMRVYVFTEPATTSTY